NNVSPQLPKPSTQFAIKALLNLLDNFDQNKGIGKSGLSFFLTPTQGAVTPEAGFTPEQNRDLLILESLEEALDLLAGDPFAAAFNHSTDLRDYRWGKLHRVTFSHVLGGPFNIPPGAGFASYQGGIPTDGALGVVDASSFDVRASDAASFTFGGGPARRMVAELAPHGPQAWEVLPGGASGVPGNRHFGDQLRLWLANDYHPVYMTDHEVKGNAESYQDFYPVR
ncbi:MAG: penicillin acylase family protein, partial [Candidatus Bipolaricaulia bacterium]